MRERDENWYELVSVQLNIRKDLLYDELSYDSILLANLMFVVRRIIQGYSGSIQHRQKHKQKYLLRATSKTQKFVCKFDVKRTVPELQHKFCDLWNQLTGMAVNDERPSIKCITETVLEHIRKLYDALHQSTGECFSIRIPYT